MTINEKIEFYQKKFASRRGSVALTIHRTRRGFSEFTNRKHHSRIKRNNGGEILINSRQFQRPQH